MRQAFLITTLFLIATNLFSQDTTFYDSDWRETEKEKAKYYRVLTQVDSLWKIEDYFINNRLQMTGFLNKPVHTARHGDFKWFFESGKLSQTGQYLNGKKHGELVFYFENGQIEFVENYKNDVLHGPFSAYTADGQITAKGTFKDGKSDGITEYWYPNGQLKSHHEFENGKKVGKWQYYDESGNLLDEILYFSKYEIIENKLVFEIPNDNWFRNKLVDNNKFIWHSFKRNAIKNIEGRNIFPNISFLVEEAGDMSDVILFSMQKRRNMPFEVDSTFIHEDGKLKIKNAIGYLGHTTYQDGSKHTVLIVHALVDKKGIQVVMDMTTDIYNEYGHEFWSALEGIYLKE